MKTANEISRFISNMETEEEYFTAVGMLFRHFNMVGVVLSPLDVETVASAVAGREPTEDELDALQSLMESVVLETVEKFAMDKLTELCRSFYNIGDTK